MLPSEGSGMAWRLLLLANYVVSPPPCSYRYFGIEDNDEKKCNRCNGESVLLGIRAPGIYQTQYIVFFSLSL